MKAIINECISCWPQWQCIGVADKYEFKAFDFPEGKIIERGKFNLKVEVLAANDAVERLLHYATQNFKIKDINIFEPELEQIIAEMYRFRGEET